MEFNSNLPIFKQIAETIKRKILSGEWELGHRIPPIRELALDMGVNPNTAQKALSLLSGEGLLRAERTSGVFVTTDKSIVDVARKELTDEEFEVFFANMQGLGYTDKEISELFEKYYKNRKG